MCQLNSEKENKTKEWRAMKMIVLGNEKIGKTFVTALVTVMDFAGQMEYSVTHQFFLSKGCVIYTFTHYYSLIFPLDGPLHCML